MDLSLPAFLSSSYSTRMLVDAVLRNTTRSVPANNVEFGKAYEKCTEKSVPERIPEESNKCKQKVWSFGITDKTQNSLLE